MHVNRLAVTIEATHQSLLQRLETATQAVSLSRPRERYARTDAFMAATSRHLAAVEEVLLPAARRRLSGGEERVREYLHEARLLEMALAVLKARLYGAVSTSHIPWEEVWGDTRRALTRHNELELSLVGDLVSSLEEDESEALADAVYRAEVKAPTRSHPYLPHRGVVGLMARRIWAVADRFWDITESRMVPKPVRPPSKEHAHDSLVAQYLVGEPMFDPDAPVVAHRRRHG